MTDRPADEATTTTTPPPAWDELAARGRFDLAAQTYRLTHDDDETLRANLEALADIQLAARDKSWRRVEKSLQRIDARHEALPWEAILRDIDALGAASAALDAREPEAARGHLERADGGGLPAEAATLMGTLAVFEGDNERARERFTTAIDLDPNHFRALTNLGNLMLEEGDVDGAIDAYERAIRMNDAFANAHHNLGVAYRRKGQVAKSVQALRRAQKEGSRRDVEDARSSLGRGTKARTPGSNKMLRWILIAAAVAAAFWFFGGRTP